MMYRTVALVYFITLILYVISIDDDKFCTRQESHTVTVSEPYQQTTLKRVVTWCAAVPPRCERYQVVWETAYRNVSRIQVVDVKSCCPGFRETGSDGACEPDCKPTCAHGICYGLQKCRCNPGYKGAACDVPCDDGRRGTGNYQECPCQNGAKYEPADGICLCAPGWEGVNCTEPCSSGQHGPECSSTCECQNRATCNHISGACICTPGYKGRLCEDLCSNNTFGLNCSRTCNCRNGGSCNPVNGECLCASGYTGSDCSSTCGQGYYGNKCLQRCTCSLNTLSRICHHVTGKCVCKPGYKGIKCEETCLANFYGLDCRNKCNCNDRGSCSPVTGKCTCNNEFSGISCEIERQRTTLEATVLPTSSIVSTFEATVLAPTSTIPVPIEPSRKAETSPEPVDVQTTTESFSGGMTGAHSKTNQVHDKFEDAGSKSDSSSIAIGVGIGLLILFIVLGIGVVYFLYKRKKNPKTDYTFNTKYDATRDTVSGLHHKNPAYDCDDVVTLLSSEADMSAEHKFVNDAHDEIPLETAEYHKSCDSFEKLYQEVELPKKDAGNQDKPYDHLNHQRPTGNQQPHYHRSENLHR